MPSETPLKIGDIPYDQHIVVDSETIKDGVVIGKGKIYTPDGEGRLIVPVSTSGVADLTKGAMQALQDATDPGAEDTDTVQVAKQKSRIILKADANLVPGQEVALKSSGSTTTADKVMASPSPRDKGYLGRIFEIYTEGTDGARKQKTADNDLVIVELGAA